MASASSSAAGVKFSAEAKTKFDAIVAKYPHREAALLPILHLAQSEFGHLSIPVQALVAKELGVPPVRVHEVTTFYEMYHEHAEGQFHLEVCTNISCHLSGADEIMDHCKKKLGIEVGHQTEDGVFGLMEAECLASCGSGPMMRVGRDYYEYLTADAVDFLIEDFRKKAKGLQGKNYDCGPEGPHVGPVKGFAPPAPVVHKDQAQPGKPVQAAAAEKPAEAEKKADAKASKKEADAEKKDAPAAS